ncbi:arylamine N-acetyltransferase family protein [Corynebacterium auriscanis]|uniref:arylamine N-acetyltransferase family protein n=1 Tax=Corynebacterium auriscanis TaxID=99807 RepID=UPI003CEDD37F
MAPKPFDLHTYLHKLGLNPADGPSFSDDFFYELPYRHANAMPFGNTEVLSGRTPGITPDEAFDKMVVRNEAGYCHEHAPLIRTAMREMGFEVRPVLARVLLKNVENPSPYTHQANLVTQGEASFLVDPGFGAGTPLHPVPLPSEGEDFGPIVDSPHGDHRIARVSATAFTEVPGIDFVLETRPHREQEGDNSSDPAADNADSNAFSGVYGFSMAPLAESDLENSNWWAATHPSSIFTSMLALARYRLDGTKVTLANAKFRVSPADGEATERELEGPEELQKVLREEFDTAISSEDARSVWAKIK